LAGSTPERIANLEEELRQRLSQIPGVLSARLSLNTPMEGSNWGEPVGIAGHPPPPGSEQSSLSSVSAHYFETIGARLVRGLFNADNTLAGSDAFGFCAANAVWSMEAINAEGSP